MTVKKEARKKINWKRTLKNNWYMLGLIAKACPGVLIVQLIAHVSAAIDSFLLNTYLYRYALNALQEGKELKRILITLTGLLVYAVLCMLIGHLSKYYSRLTYPKVDAYIQNLLQKKAAEVDLACFDQPAFYDAYVKATGEATDRAYTVMYTAMNVLWIVIQIGTVGTLIVTIDPIFLVLAFLPLLCTLILGKKRNRIKYEYSMRNKEATRQRDYVRRTFYLKDFSKEMRLTNMWKVMFNRMHASVAEMKEIVRKYGFTMMFFRYFFDFIFDVVVRGGSMILAAFKTLVKKNMLLGDCFTVINSIVDMASNINNMGNAFLQLDENSLYIDNLRSFLEYEVQIAEDEAAPQVTAFETLELKQVTFGYDSQKMPVLSDVSLTVHAGEKIAIVGHNGAGKTTLIKLLQRFYDPDAGEILLNSEPVSRYRLSSYRNLFGTVFQDYHLFATTVAENIMLRGEITDADRALVEDALIKAGMDSKIKSLPHGVDSNVTKEFDSDGAVFSGGEAQKISIARIFAGKPEIVMMDEPTSALDPIAEQEMYSNMFEACEGKTVIFISHRLSSAVMADRVYLFENGRIAEQGTHSELLALNGKYADMWHKQADSYADAEEVTA